MEYKVDARTHVFACGWCCAPTGMAQKGVVCSCRKLVYCCADHQRSHFPKHKRACQLVKEFLAIKGYNDILQFPEKLHSQIKLTSKLVDPTQLELVAFGPSSRVEGAKVDAVNVCKTKLESVANLLPTEFGAAIMQDDLYEFFVPVVHFGKHAASLFLLPQ